MSHSAMSMAGERVDHERPAADVAMGAVDLLPEVLDARRVLAVEQFEQRLGQRLRRRADRRPSRSPQPVMPWLVSILT